MVASRRKKDESGRSLLDAKKNRGLLGLRRSRVSVGRSDNPGSTKTGLSSAPHWGKVRLPSTPPLTPRSATAPAVVEDDEVEVNATAPVPNVTLVKGGFPAKESAQEREKDPKKEVPPSDDHSEYSDLTDNRTQKRLIELKTAHVQATQEQRMREKALMDSLSSNNSGGINSVPLLKEETKGRHPVVDESHDVKKKGSYEKRPRASPPDPPETSFITELFGLMDICRSSDAHSVEEAQDFVPEWGVSPEYDDTEINEHRPEGRPNNQKDGIPSSRLVSPTTEIDPISDCVDNGIEPDTLDEGGAGVEVSEEEILSDTEKSRNAHKQDLSVLSPRSTHENFEMVLEELQEDEFSPKRNSWIKNPFNRGRKGDADTALVEEMEDEQKKKKKRDHKIPTDKAHQDMVKQALFPDYEDPANTHSNHPKDLAKTRDHPLLFCQPVSTEIGTQVSENQNLSTKRKELTPEPQQLPTESKDDRIKAARLNPSKDTNEQEEKKEEEEKPPALELPQPQARTKKSKIGRILLSPFCRCNKEKTAPKLGTVQEGKTSRPTEIYLSASGARPNPSPLTELTVAKDVVEVSRRNSRDAGLSSKSLDAGGTADGDIGQSSSGPEPSGGGRTPLVVEGAGSEEYGDGGGRRGPGFVGGFMAMISETVAAVQAGKPIPKEVENIPDKHPSNIAPSNTWKEGNETQGEAAKDMSAQDFQRSKSAPQKVGAKKFKRRKRIWKEVKDPNSGRLYYYHRGTRQTTWTRPKEMDTAFEEETEIVKSSEPQQSKDVYRSTPEPDQIQNMRSQRENSSEEKLDKVRQARGEIQSATSTDALRKSSERDFDPTVWRQKEMIIELLQSMPPPDGTSIESLLAEHEGRENELLAHLRQMKDSRPFDEPIGVENDGDVMEGETAVAELNSSMRTRDSSHPSFSRSESGTTSRQSESTQVVANTKSPRRLEESTIGGTTVSSRYGRGTRIHQSVSVSRIPSKIPAPRVRSRELRVEEFSQARYKSETFNNDLRPAQQQQTYPRIMPFTTPYEPTINEEEEPDDSDSSHVYDSVSALSVNELEFVQPGDAANGLDAARRRALDEALRRQDWDMAAAISEGMRGFSPKEANRPKQDPGEWKQSELDKFISENDWGAVSEYIAHFRSKSKVEYPANDRAEESKNSSMPPKKGKYSETIASGKTGHKSRRRSHGSSRTGEGSNRSPRMKKRFGARSQLQHNSIIDVEGSDSSEDGESGMDSGYYSTESTSSVPPPIPRVDQRLLSGKYRKQTNRKLHYQQRLF